MNAEAVRARIVATLSADANVRRAAELELKQVWMSTALTLRPCFAFDGALPFLAILPLTRVVWSWRIMLGDTT